MGVEPGGAVGMAGGVTSTVSPAQDLPDLLLGEAKPTPGSGAWRRFLGDRSAVTGMVIVVALVLLAILGPTVAPRSPIKIDTNRLLEGPSHGAWFGTDNLGRDIFSRVVAGARVSISLAILIGALMVTLGVIVGTVAGYFGTWIDSVIMRAVDIFLAFPTLILALAIAGTLGAGYRSLVIALVATGWPTYARLIRGGVLAERERQYIDAVRGVGGRPRRIMLRHILPNAMSPILVLLSFDLGTVILFIAALGYLGVGIPPPTPEWGTMVSDGKNFVFTAPQMIVFPGLAVAIAVIGFNLLGDGVRNALDPRQRSRRKRRRASRASIIATTRHGQRVDSSSPHDAADPADALLAVDNLSVRIEGRHGQTVAPVQDVTLSLGAGETVGLVGESGCGKTMTALAIIGLLPPGATIVGGRVGLSGRDLTSLSEPGLRRLRGRRVGMVFQDPSTSLNPTSTIGEQIAAPVRFHLGATRAEARERAIEVLRLVGMPRPAERLGDYPHQLSGGQRQRVMIAMALVCKPSLLIADEPTTSLDVSIQDQILSLLEDLKSRLGMGLLLITHDMGVIARMADRVLVMYAGRVVESATTAELIDQPRHPYTEALLESIPRIDEDRARTLHTIPGRPPELTGMFSSCPFAPRCSYATERCRREDPPLITGADGHRYACFHPVSARSHAAATVGRAAVTRLQPAASPEPILVVDEVVKEFRVGRAQSVKAVSGVSFRVAKGETFGLVGESGCGKTTLGRLIVALERPDSGSVRVGGHDLALLHGAALRRSRRDFQLIFQDPFGSLDPRLRIGSTLREPLIIHRLGTASEQTARITRLLDEVGLEQQAVAQYPHEFSGGQRQRIGFARVLTLNSSLIVADEPVSSLDVSIRSQILNLMRRLQDEHELTYVLISHDLSVVRYLADRVGVMYLGKLVEVGKTPALFNDPLHPYTAGLLAAVPSLDQGRKHTPRAVAVSGELPSAIHPPSGCRFRTRCPLAQAVCASEEPPLRSLDSTDHEVACHFPLGAGRDLPDSGDR